MADNHTPEQRRYNMSRIRSKNNAPEESVRKELFRQGFRYKKNVQELPGKPDIVIAKYRAVIFVNGCFWHMHNCGRFHWPQTNADYWVKKINRNIERDQQNYEKLSSLGWKVIIVWECQLSKDKINNTMEELNKKIVNE